MNLASPAQPLFVCSAGADAGEGGGGGAECGILPGFNYS